MSGVSPVPSTSSSATARGSVPGAPADPGSATILDAIGHTPLIRVDDIWVKLEFLNPSGSIKARIAKYMIERAEREGLLRPGDTIVEASSGNTGNAMSMVAAVKGYRMLVVMPDGMSPERMAISRAFGAEVLKVGDFHVTEALERAREIGTQPGFFAPQQFDNEWNVDENREWLGPEILAGLPAGVVPDAIVDGVGTGGTLVGVGQAFRAVNPACDIVGVEPNESCTLMCGEVGKHLIEGISDGFVRASSPATGRSSASSWPWTRMRRSARCAGWPASSASSSARAPARTWSRPTRTGRPTRTRRTSSRSSATRARSTSRTTSARSDSQRRYPRRALRRGEANGARKPRRRSNGLDSLHRVTETNPSRSSRPRSGPVASPHEAFLPLEAGMRP